MSAATVAVSVSRETHARLVRFIDLLRDANQQQNLIAASTLETIWDRHIADSLQLLRFAPRNARRWADLGSGAGLPGIVLACAGVPRIDLIEARRLRAEFLGTTVRDLGLTNAAVIKSQVERVQNWPYDVIVARAFAPLDRLFDTAAHLADRSTIWILPKGRSAISELDAARQTWQGEFRIEPSVTDPQSSIIIARHVGRQEAA